MLLLDSYIIDISVADVVSATLMSNCNCRVQTVQLLYEPSGSSTVTVPSLISGIGYSVILCLVVHCLAR